MKLLSVMAKLLCIVTAAAALASGAELAGYKTVYLLPMSSGLDQFLAIKLTTGAVMQVVTDPRKADVVFTDKIGSTFEEKLDELYGQKPKTDDKDGKESLNSTPRIAAVSHGKGAIFLVDRRTRDVVWSAYVKAKSAAPDDMNHVAGEIAGRLEQDRKGK
jgi:hypothetical protein